MAIIRGTQGADNLNGTDGPDVIIGWADGGDRERDIGDVLDGGRGSDQLYGGGDGDVLAGEDGDDVLFGGSGGDALIAGAGDDRLEGGPGPDELLGQAGIDTFVFSRRSDKDLIKGFQNNRDMIELGSDLGVASVRDALSHAKVENGNTVFRFDGGDVLTVQGITNPDQLRNDLFII